MKQIKNIAVSAFVVIICSCNYNKNKVMKEKSIQIENKKSSIELSCKLTTPELQNRKATVLESLRKQIIEKKELPNGYAYKFKTSDSMIDELTEFIKTERQCCDFFNFNLSVTGEQTLWFEITGEKGAKEFIKSELEL